MKQVLTVLIFLAFPLYGFSQAISFTASADTICQNNSITFTNTSTGVVDSLHWVIRGIAIPDRDSGSITVLFATSGLDTVKLYTYHGGVADSAMQIVAVIPIPMPQLITSPCCSITGSYLSYQWFQNIILIPGATNNAYNGVDGCYFVQVDSAGCYSKSGSFCDYSGAGVQNTNMPGAYFTLYPNPSNSVLSVICGEALKTISITNAAGQVCYKAGFATSQAEIDISNFPSGLYFVRANDQYVQQFLKE